jgi:cytochrome c oxidase assembly protein subunit 15
MKDNKKVIYWLLTGCTLIFIMVIVGGITRLTHSGLSISNYKLISGTIPPTNAVEWKEAFDLYKQYPEYQKLNYNMTLEAFKDIYFWEWIHRVIGRVIGLIFVIPFLYFLIRKQLTIPTIKKCIILLFMGSFQGFLGWYMVKSGLVERPDVSHYRLAMHLTTAFLTFAYTFWVALDLVFPSKKEIKSSFRNIIRVGLVVLVIQIIWGAFVAGLDAGWIHNHWPLMNDGQLVHETVTTEQEPLWRNFIEGKSGFKTRKMKTTILQQKGANLLLILVGVQFILGVLTLVLFVPVWLGVLHQITAFFLLAAMTFTLHRFSK